ncbi:MAG: fibronectin type III-like domain-contianing protein, partial [Bacteroidales bacterium]|nr:fibronectin type III-like domain-contianing protein [Bacteroidales bacterium]
YGAMKASAGKDAVQVSFELTNEGAMDADEVVQLYVRRIDSKVAWPAKELKAFARVNVPAGGRQTVTLSIPYDDLRYWDVDKNAWALERGRLELLLGAASDDIRQKAEVSF